MCELLDGAYQKLHNEGRSLVESLILS